MHVHHCSALDKNRDKHTITLHRWLLHSEIFSTLIQALRKLKFRQMYVVLGNIVESCGSFVIIFRHTDVFLHFLGNFNFTIGKIIAN